MATKAKPNRPERYVRAWRVWRSAVMEKDGRRVRTERPIGRHLGEGAIVFVDRMVIERVDGELVVKYDSLDPNFYAAIFLENDKAAPRIAVDDLRRLRRYVIDGEGAVPMGRPPGDEPPTPSRSSAA